MIDREIFKASREAARLKLPPDIAAQSFGYYIDIASGWDNYKSPEALINFLGIHQTHQALYNEIADGLGKLSAEEKDWIKKYVPYYESIARLLTTTGFRTELKYDLAETLTDWRYIKKFAGLPGWILDFGAGCGRQGVSAYLWNSQNIYTAVDSTIAAYIIQNLALSNLPGRFYDFLDYETAGKPAPWICKAQPGERYHVPTWLLENNTPERYFNVIIAAHVHNELSGPDFLRFIDAVDKGLADNGIVYVRSEITVMESRDYFDAIDLHAIDLVDIMKQKGLVPVFCRHDTFITTIFARKESVHAKNTINVKTSRELSIIAADNLMEENWQRVFRSPGKVALVGQGSPFYDLYVKPNEQKIKDKITCSESEFKVDINRIQPDCIVIATQNYGSIEAELKKAGLDFPVRKQYWYPLVFLFKKSQADEFFSHSIKTPDDLKEIL